jgi:hypothetical protein
LPASDSPSAAR